MYHEVLIKIYWMKYFYKCCSQILQNYIYDCTLKFVWRIVKIYNTGPRTIYLSSRLQSLEPRVTLRVVKMKKKFCWCAICFSQIYCFDVYDRKNTWLTIPKCGSHKFNYSWKRFLQEYSKLRTYRRAKPSLEDAKHL